MSDIFNPDTVLFGAAGVSFDNDNIRVAYQWADELSTQTALATRSCGHRVLICDHLKMGRTSGWLANITLEGMMANAMEVSIITTEPDANDPLREICDAQIASFHLILQRLAREPKLAGRELRLLQVDSEARLKRELTLSSVRARVKAADEKTRLATPQLNGRSRNAHAS
jgi:hypothetical protein